MTFLLDVNLLIALLDKDHAQNTPARLWFDALRGPWATCPVTEMGVVRILSGPRYPKGMSTPGAVIGELEKLQRIGRHEFWADDLSMVDVSVFRVGQMQRSSQITDSYLLALAVVHGGKLATFDARLEPAAVRNGTEALLLLPS